ncbi:MAG: hypothetical protein M1814_000699 [Vezdaea aestivalis]|nr:MAG: hypothetical protein M1814_000699 [Vezdaea aestivalis]
MAQRIHTVREYKKVCRAYVSLLGQWQAKFGLKEDEAVDDLTILIIALTDARDFWSTKEIAGAANDVLASTVHTNSRSIKNFRHFLVSIVQPLFSRKSDARLTAIGRKSMQPKAPRYSLEDFSASSKPWKYRQYWIVAVFSWVIREIETKEIEECWPVIIPPLLTLIDDESIYYKAKGCEILQDLLPKVQPQFIKRTGIGDVFKDAVMPCLHYLPSLTPAYQSSKLLAEAYPTLLKLSASLHEQQITDTQKLDFLDDILISGALGGIDHTTNVGDFLENAPVIQVLLEQIPVLIDEMGTWAMAHVQSLIPFLCNLQEVCTEPAQIQSLSRSLKVIIQNAWPAIAPFEGQITEAAARIWLGTNKGGSKDAAITASIAEGIMKDMRSLSKSKQNWVDCQTKFVAAQPRLRHMMGLDEQVVNEKN